MEFPNSRAYVAFTVYFEHDGVPISMLLDIVEVAKSHYGNNLAETFAKMLKDFGIADKVCFSASLAYSTTSILISCFTDPWCNCQQCL